jgi:hypothetical protein
MDDYTVQSNMTLVKLLEALTANQQTSNRETQAVLAALMSRVNALDVRPSVEVHPANVNIDSPINVAPAAVNVQPANVKVDVPVNVAPAAVSVEPAHVEVHPAAVNVHPAAVNVHVARDGAKKAIYDDNNNLVGFEPIDEKTR